jgi:hypothetical protein
MYSFFKNPLFLLHQLISFQYYCVMDKIFKFSLFFIKMSIYAANQQVCLLIHGTWGNNSSWHDPSSEFYKTLEANLLLSNIKLVNFNWPGKLSYEKRQIAGKNLANLINSYPTNTKFIIVSHSHGGNVGIIASQLLSEPKKISIFYSLGLPIDDLNYLPNMQVIEKFYNIFSFGDLYQTAIGMHQRVFSKIPGVYNINIEVNFQKPQHEDLHSPVIAKWLPYISKFFANLNYDSHYFARFYDNYPPNIFIDTQISEKLSFDNTLNERICLGLLGSYSSFRTPSDKCNFPAN